MVLLYGYLAVALLFALWGAVLAGRRGRSRLLWAIVCAFTLLIGIAVLLSRSKVAGLPEEFAEDLESESPMDVAEFSPSDYPPMLARISDELSPADALTSDNIDRGEKRWKYLAEYHPKVRAAVADVTPLGVAALAELKDIYLTLGDSDLLPDIAMRLREKYQPAKSGRSGSKPGTPLLALGVSNRTKPTFTLADALRQDGANGQLNGTASETSSSSILNGSHASVLGELGPGMSASPPGGRAAAETASVAGKKEGTALSARRLVQTEDKVRTDADEGDDADPEEDILGLDGLSRSTSTLAIADATSAHPPIELERNPLTSGSMAGVTAQASEPSPKDETSETSSSATGGSAVPSAGKPIPGHTIVTPSDLEGAQYLETYSGVHLFELIDGRVFVDRLEARPSIDAARRLVDDLAQAGRRI
jgi:hypothetical protein